MVADLNAAFLPTSCPLLVVKVGSSLLVQPDGNVRRQWLETLVADISARHKAGQRVVIVTSGAIALGARRLGFEKGGRSSLADAQAAASVGQIVLSGIWAELLDAQSLAAAQMLVTLDDLEDRRRYLNIAATLDRLLGAGAVPVINENDSVATEEIRFGDNDRLAAQIAVTVGADQLVLLSDVDGFYTANPKEDNKATRFDLVAKITPAIEAMAGDPVSGMSKGGMKTKLLAAKTAVAGGCAMAIMEGSVLRPLQALAQGANRTWFIAQGDPQAARKRWINAMKPRGELRLDAGAVVAMAQGKSLLPAGVTSVTGTFGRGDPVALVSPEGDILGKGLVRYTAVEAKAIAGHRSGEIEAILGYQGRAALVHRDDLVI